VAQNSFLNCSAVDPAATSKTDRQNHVHTCGIGTAAAGDATFSYDSAKVPSKTIARSIFEQLLLRANNLTGP
jgi:hypothetical protein